MSVSPRPPIPGESRRWRVVLAVALLSALGVTLFLATRRPAPLVEVHRQNLQLREGRWYAPGQTNGFTGFLLETYDDGARKSRSAVFNGWLHGLSEGWHTNGVKQVEEHFVAGISHGRRTKWHSGGQKLSEVNIVNGQLEGAYRSWHDNGQPSEMVGLKSGQPDGLSRAWFPSGFLKSRVILSNGKVVEQKFWKDGEQQDVLEPGETASTRPGLVSGK